MLYYLKYHSSISCEITNLQIYLICHFYTSTAPLLLSETSTLLITSVKFYHICACCLPEKNEHQQEMPTLSEHLTMSSQQLFVGFVLHNLQFSAQCFVDHCLSFCPFCFDQCIFCLLILMASSDIIQLKLLLHLCVLY